MLQYEECPSTKDYIYKDIFKQTNIHFEIALGSFESASNYYKDNNEIRKRIEGDKSIVGPFEYGKPDKNSVVKKSTLELYQ
ncbi:1775_t:CDS:2 [Dentiscutata erythropus]|uniref:1775_t:CDS:1 n=1 Tax=Dentiscutata erythropus TaxID=1348616 RepID=A0A9N9HNX5_9GLOM|nr:1775_t:CDS:2 [Dentiscutata erythropus]